MLLFKNKNNSLPGYDLFVACKEERYHKDREEKTGPRKRRHLSMVLEKGDQSDLEEKGRHQFATINLLSNPARSVRERNKRNHVSYGTEYRASDNEINIEVDS